MIECELIEQIDPGHLRVRFPADPDGVYDVRYHQRSGWALLQREEGPQE